MGRRFALLGFFGLLVLFVACSDKRDRAPLIPGTSSGGGASSGTFRDGSVGPDSGAVVTLTDTLVAPGSLLVTTSHVFWVDRGGGATLGSIQRAALPTGAPEIIAKDLPGPTSIAIDSTGALFVALAGKDATLPGIYRVLNGAISAVATGPEDEGASSLVAEKTDLFWLSISAGGNALRRKPATGAAVTIGQELSGTFGEHSVAVVGAQVFAALDSGGSGTLIRAEVTSTGGAGELVATVTGGLGQIVSAPDGKSLLGTSAGSIVRVDIATSKATPLITGLGTPTVLARDGNNLFFFDAKVGTVARVSTAGGTPERILDGFSTVSSMAITTNGAFLAPGKSIVFVRF